MTETTETRPTPGGPEAAALPLHLTCWQRSDWLLLSLALVGLLLFFPFFERTSLAPRTKVSFDRTTLRRIAEDSAKRLGAPLSNQIHIGVIARENLYDYLAEKAGSSVARELADHPVPYWYWFVHWVVEGRVWSIVQQIDDRGSLLSFFSRDFRAGSGSEPLSLEEAKPLAEKALADFYNRDAAQLRLESAVSDSVLGRPSTQFVWINQNDYHGLTQRYEVRLVGRDISVLDAGYSTPEGYVHGAANWGDVVTALVTLALVVSLAVPLLVSLAVVVGLALTILGFFQRRQVDLWARWRILSSNCQEVRRSGKVDLWARWRILSSIVGFLLGAWMALRAWTLVEAPTSLGTFLFSLWRNVIFGWLAGPMRITTELWTDQFLTPLPRLFLFTLAPLAVCMSGAFFLGTIYLEWAIRRAAPARLVSFASLFDRRAFTETCGLAVLRGAFLGLTLLGVDTLFVWLGTTYLPVRLDSSLHIEFPSHTSFGSPWPTTESATWSLHQTIAIAWGLGFLASFVGRFLRHPWLAALVTAGVAVPCWIYYDLAAIQPVPWKLLLLGCESLLLFWTFHRFDLLTLMWTVFTFSFWWEEYRLLVMFEPTGALGPWTALLLWGALVVASGAIAFQSPLRVAYRRVAAALE